MDDTTASPDHDQLFQIASEQGGYFAAAQARACGISHSLLAHHSGNNGRFLRIRRGLYRIRHYPPSPREEVLAAWLAAGPECAVVSHDSALELLELSDIVPETVHLTVPRAMRYRSATPGVKIHTTSRDLQAPDIVVRDGMRVTSPIRSILDATETGTAPDQMITAVNQALDRGMATGRQFTAAASQRSGRVRRLVSRAIAQRAPS